MRLTITLLLCSFLAIDAYPDNANDDEQLAIGPLHRSPGSESKDEKTDIMERTSTGMININNFLICDSAIHVYFILH